MQSCSETAFGTLVLEASGGTSSQHLGFQRAGHAPVAVMQAALDCPKPVRLASAHHGVLSGPPGHDASNQLVHGRLRADR